MKWYEKVWKWIDAKNYEGDPQPVSPSTSTAPVLLPEPPALKQEQFSNASSEEKHARTRELKAKLVAHNNANVIRHYGSHIADETLAKSRAAPEFTDAELAELIVLDDKVKVRPEDSVPGLEVIYTPAGGDFLAARTPKVKL